MKQVNKRKNVIVVGCGSIGAALANAALKRDQNVTVIDQCETSFVRLTSSYSGFTLVGDGTETAALESAGIQDTDVLIAATDDDDINIMISQIAASHYKIKHVLAKVADINKKKAYDGLKIQTVCPALLSVKEAEKELFDSKDEAV